jgi:hypothetical protein
MEVVNQGQAAPKVTLVPPSPYGYVLILSEIDTPSVATEVDAVQHATFAATDRSVSSKRADLHKKLLLHKDSLASVQAIRSIAIFEAILFAPGSLDRFQARGTGGHPARYDTLILIETTSPATAGALATDPTLRPLLTLVTQHNSHTKVVAASNAKKIADVDRQRDGVFLWNFFFADDPEALLNIWDHTAGWWLAEGEMYNSELLRPTQNSEYALINNARWDAVQPPAKAFSNPDYAEFVLANIEANNATAMPSLYRLVS